LLTASIEEKFQTGQQRIILQRAADDERHQNWFCCKYKFWTRFSVV